MMKRWLSGIIAFLFIVSWAGSAWALEPFKINQYVTDRAGMMSETQANQLAVQLHQYAQDTGNQLLVVTVPGLEGREAVEFTEALFKLNQPGQKDKDNGLILFVAKQERKIRIEVGYGLEEKVPDGKAGTIIRGEISPRFKTGDFSGGIVAGMYAVIHAITPEYQLTNEPAPARRPSRSGRGFSPGAFLVFVIIAIMVNIFRGNNSSRRRYHRGGYSEPWFWGGGGSSGGGFFGGDSGGSSGDSGFSGGGGDFGGGGASGDW